MDFLAQCAFVIVRDGCLFIDDQACYCLPVSIADEMCFRFIQFKAHLKQHFFDFLIGSVKRTVGRKGHIVAVASIGDLALAAPATDLVVKTTHDDIGECRRCR